MTLTDDQKAIVSKWIEEGANLHDIQKRLKEELQIGLTYMETRFLLDDLKLALKEPEPPPVVEPPVTEEPVEDIPAGNGKVSVTIDQITKVGAMISGRVTFSDGEKAGWYLDQTGRLGLDTNTPGYRPTQPDVLDFQAELERLARTQGL